MPSYTILPASRPGLVIVDITHDDGTVRTNVGFHIDYYEDTDDLKAQLEPLVLENQVTQYANKARAAAKGGRATALKGLEGQVFTVAAK